MDYDTIIIGAGMSGLAAGIRLALYDQKVCILEKHYAVGGLNSYYHLGGRRFDVGLHAMTNYADPKNRSAPLSKLYRQLRIKPEEFDLHEQDFSSVAFPGHRLRFSNDFSLLTQEVRDQFPGQIDAFLKLTEAIRNHNELDLEAPPRSARGMVSGFLSDPVLQDMIFCPLLFYGSAQENDMEWGQFVIMFKSIYFEGFARPHSGVRKVIGALVRRYLSLGGELRKRSGVRRILVQHGRAEEIELESGETLSARWVISSAGNPETMRLLSSSAPDPGKAGALSFMETISCLNGTSDEPRHPEAIVFYCNEERFRYQKPEGLIDTRSGIICCPNNFRFPTPLPERVIRLSHLANFDLWNALPETEYRAAKERCRQEALEAAVRHVPDFRKSIVFSDTFTPRTIRHYTGHLNGAVYGSPDKRKNGRTHLENLFLCGTDQGFLGIVGAILSGISMANLHVLGKLNRS
jgi:phytoene dehydrogenase-like protein